MKTVIQNATSVWKKMYIASYKGKTRIHFPTGAVDTYFKCFWEAEQENKIMKNQG